MMRGLILMCVCFTIIGNISAQSNLYWTNPVEVAPSSFGNDYPRLSVNTQAEPVLTWGSNAKVYFSKIENGTFTPPIRLNNDSTQAYIAAWTGADMVARNDTIYACFMHKTWSKKSYLVASFDGGNTFTPPYLIENYPDSISRFPTVAIDPRGQPLVGIMKMASNESHPNYVIRKSTNYGVTFTEESNVGGWSGLTGEACDCCPAAICTSGNYVSLLYRDNLENIRDVWAGLSTDGGATFDTGFAVDNSEWQAFVCPATGPDGVIIEDKLYSVFYSDGLSFFSKTDLLTGQIEKISQLGETPQTGGQNYPRITHFGKQVAITWKGSHSGTQLHVAYANDITSGAPMVFDTLYQSSFASSDIALSEDGLHVIWEDNGSGTVKYVKGIIVPTAVENLPAISMKIYPNPVSEQLFITTDLTIKNYQIFGINQQLICSGQNSKIIDVSSLIKGVYTITIETIGNKIIQKQFIKN